MHLNFLIIPLQSYIYKKKKKNLGRRRNLKVPFFFFHPFQNNKSSTKNIYISCNTLRVLRFFNYTDIATPELKTS